MITSTRHTSNTTEVAVCGRVDSSGAGLVYDVLVEAARFGRERLVIDVSRISRITRAGVRGFVVAARLVRARNGDMQIRGASLEVEKVLGGLGYRDLIRFDRTVAPSSSRPPSAPAGHAASSRNTDHEPERASLLSQSVGTERV